MPGRGRPSTVRGGTTVRVQSKAKNPKGAKKSSTLVLSSHSKIDDTVTQSSLDLSQSGCNEKVKMPETGVSESGLTETAVQGAEKSVNVIPETGIPVTAIPEAGNVFTETGLSETAVLGDGNSETMISENEATETEVSESELLAEGGSEESSFSMNSEDLHKAQFDGTLGDPQMITNVEDVEMTEVHMSANNLIDTPTSHLEPMIKRFNMLGARPKPSSPKHDPQISPIGNSPKEERSEMVEKLDEMMRMMQDIKDVKNDMNRLDRQIQKMEETGNNSNSKLAESVQKVVEESITKLGTNLRQNINNDIDDRVKESVVEEVEVAMQEAQANIMLELEERIETVTSQKVHK